MTNLTYRQTWEFLDTGVRMGTVTPFTLILGSHVLHRMAEAKGRVLRVSLPELYGAALCHPGTNKYVAGSIESVVHEGAGTPLARLSYDTQISVLYIDALQKLHASGLLANTLADSSIPALPCISDLDRHFTFLPTLQDGRDWRESSVIEYHMSRESLGSVARRFAGLFDPAHKQPKVAAAFL